jgi:hypothetical protein
VNSKPASPAAPEAAATPEAGTLRIPIRSKPRAPAKSADSTKVDLKKTST